VAVRQNADNSPVFRWIIKFIYVVYLVIYAVYAVSNYLNGEGSFLVNVIVLSFTSLSALILIITTIMDYVVKDSDTRSTAKVTLHTLKNMFKVIKVGVSVLVLINTISDNSWNAFNIIVIVISLPVSLLLLCIEYIYFSIAKYVRYIRNGGINLDDLDDDEAAVLIEMQKHRRKNRRNAGFFSTFMTGELTGEEDVDTDEDTLDAVRSVRNGRRYRLPSNYSEPELVLEEELEEIKIMHTSAGEEDEEYCTEEPEMGYDIFELWPRVVPSRGKIYPKPVTWIPLPRKRKKYYDRRRGGYSIDRDHYID